MQRAVPSPVYCLFGSVFAWLDLLLLQQPLTLHCAFLTLPVGRSVLLPAENVVASWQLIPPSETVAQLLYSAAPSETTVHLLHLVAPSELAALLLHSLAPSELFEVVGLAFLGLAALLDGATGGAHFWLHWGDQ